MHGCPVYCLYLTAFVLHGGCLVTFLLWGPNPVDLAVFYVLAALWGMGDAVIQTQINGRYSPNISYSRTKKKKKLQNSSIICVVFMISSSDDCHYQGTYLDYSRFKPNINIYKRWIYSILKLF